MSSNIKKTKNKLIRKLKNANLQPILAVILGVSLLSLINFGFVNANKDQPVKNQTTEKNQTVSNGNEAETEQPNQNQNPESTQQNSNQAEPESLKLNTNNQSSKPASQTSSGAQPAPSKSASNSPNSTQQAQNSLSVKLSVNGNFAGSLSLSAGANQCEVLSSALRAGLISGLDMRYSSAQKSMGVYKINGIGNSDSVWWVYTVNGKSPPLGCSGIKVNNGDTVNWKYIKS